MTFKELFSNFDLENLESISVDLLAVFKDGASYNHKRCRISAPLASALRDNFKVQASYIAQDSQEEVGILDDNQYVLMSQVCRLDF